MNKILRFLENQLGKSKNTKRGFNQHAFKCPFCLHHLEPGAKNLTPLEINFDDIKHPKIHCWACNFAGGKNWKKLFKQNILIEFSALLNIPLFFEEQQEQNLKSLLTSKFLNLIKTPDSKTINLQTLELSENNFQKQLTLNYLKQRNIFNEDIIRNKLSISLQKPQYVFLPSYDKKGKFNYYVGRNILKTYYRKFENMNDHSSNIVFNEYRLDYQNPIFLVEGMFDYIKLTRHNHNVGFLMGANNQKNAVINNILYHKTPVILAFDNDKAGKQSTKRLKKIFTEHEIKCQIFKMSDNYKDIDKIPSDELKKTIDLYYNY